MTPATCRWLLDTNVLSELRKKRRSDRSVRTWAELNPLEGCAISVISVVEVRLGIEALDRAALRASLEGWLSDILLTFKGRVLPVDEAVLTCWRRLCLEGQKANDTFSQPDALIAATAIVGGLGLVTRNTKDFTRTGVALVNPWTTPVT